MRQNIAPGRRDVIGAPAGIVQIRGISRGSRQFEKKDDDAGIAAVEGRGCGQGGVYLWPVGIGKPGETVFSRVCGFADGCRGIERGGQIGRSGGLVRHGVVAPRWNRKGSNGTLWGAPPIDLVSKSKRYNIVQDDAKPDGDIGPIDSER